MENKRSIGKEKENLAALYFSQRGYDIVEKNFYSCFGEIDLIVKKEDTLVFAEVKYRKNESRGNPLEAVNVRKQKRICRAALYYLSTHCLSVDTPCRFDVVAITGDEITHIENAFEFHI